MFAGGMVGIGYETVIEHTDRPILLAVFAGMIGLPVFWASEAKLKGGE